jgi:4a-hydroxytetrahydrobiopterin dehydratase
MLALEAPRPLGENMPTLTADQLATKKCAACEGNMPKYSSQEAEQQLKAVSGWRLTHDGQRIRKDWVMKDFMAGLEFFNEVSKLAESEDHHPDLHLEGYRNARIEIWTHAVGGLSENDFVLAAKIDRLPVKLKASK